MFPYLALSLQPPAKANALLGLPYLLSQHLTEGAVTHLGEVLAPFVTSQKKNDFGF